MSRSRPSGVHIREVGPRDGFQNEPEHTATDDEVRRQGLANTLAALESGCSSFESSLGELGGCPVPPGSTDNIAP